VPLIVEKLLPNRFFELLGRYTATCAHIERAVWLIVIRSENRYPDNPEDVHWMLNIRRRSEDLLTALDDCISKLNGTKAERLQKVSIRIRDGLLNRHMAIHGAWSYIGNKSYDVEYFKNLGTKRDPDWRRWAEPIRESQLEFAVEDANSILSELDSVLSELSPKPNAD
jgi:hypothetical protein